VGLWRSDQQEFKIVRQPDGKYRLSDVPTSAQKSPPRFRTILFVFEKTAPQTYKGSGFSSDSGCVFDFTYDLSFSDAATKLSITGKRARYTIPDLAENSSDIDALRASHRACAQLVREGLLSGNAEMALDRVR